MSEDKFTELYENSDCMNCRYFSDDYAPWAEALKSGKLGFCHFNGYMTVPIDAEDCDDFEFPKWVYDED